MSTLPSSNTDSSTKTDRQATGAQPDNTPVGGAGTNPGPGGGVTQLLAGTGIAITPAGGTGVVTVNNTGSFTNPMTTLGDMIRGGASGALTRLAVQTSGHRRYLAEVSAVAPTWVNWPIFNVVDYGADPTGATDTTTAIQAAVTAAAASLSSPLACATVYLPGLFQISAAITLPGGFTGRIAIKGDSQMGSKILVQTSSIYVFDLDLSAGGNNGALNSAEISDLSFSAASGVVATGAVHISYGKIASSEISPGPVVRNITILGTDGTTDGFVNGVVLNNSWHSRVESIYGYGNGTSYDTGSGAGSGSLISYTGQSVNHTIATIGCDFWDKCISVVATTGNVFQGFAITNVNATQSPFGIYFGGVASCGGIQISNYQCDNGNISGQSTSYGLYAVSTGDLTLTNFAFFCGGTVKYGIGLIAGAANIVNVAISNGRFAGNGTPGIIGINAAGWTGGIMDGLIYTGFTYAFALDAACSNVQRGQVCDENLYFLPGTDASTACGSWTGAKAMLRLTASQTIATGTGTPVNWLNLAQDDSLGVFFPIITAGSFVIGQSYQIATVGTTSFTSIGASANTVGVGFVATGIGSGTGTAYSLSIIKVPPGARKMSVSAYGKFAGTTAGVDIKIYVTDQSGNILASSDSKQDASGGVPIPSVNLIDFDLQTYSAVTGFIVNVFQNSGGNLTLIGSAGIGSHNCMVSVTR